MEARLREDNRNLMKERTQLQDIMGNLTLMHADLEKSGENEKRRLERQGKTLETQVYDAFHTEFFQSCLRYAAVRICVIRWCEIPRSRDILYCRKMPKSESFVGALTSWSVSSMCLLISPLLNLPVDHRSAYISPVPECGGGRQDPLGSTCGRLAEATRRSERKVVGIRILWRIRGRPTKWHIRRNYIAGRSG
jgi:hypothetical protein